MSRGGDTRFQKGQSGNPAGRPKARRPHVSAFDIIFDRKLTVTQGGVERELSVDEALELQTYRAALTGNRMAIRKVLKMIASREAALAKRYKPETLPIVFGKEFDSDNANEALCTLGIIEKDPFFGDDRPRYKLANWATQAALSRPGRHKFDDKEVKDITFFTRDADQLHWPRGRRA